MTASFGELCSLTHCDFDNNFLFPSVYLWLLCLLLSQLAKPALSLQVHLTLKSQLLELLHFSTRSLRLMHPAVRELNWYAA